ncbi:MAG: hypothetical protein ACXWL5_04040 [Candidatus Chromulinivorax sp.]
MFVRKLLQNFLAILIVISPLHSLGMFFRKKSEKSAPVRDGIKAGITNFVANRVEEKLNNRFNPEKKVENNQSVQKIDQQNNNAVKTMQPVEGKKYSATQTVQPQNSNQKLQTFQDVDLKLFVDQLQNLKHHADIQARFELMIDQNPILKKINRKQEEEVTCCQDLQRRCLDLLPEEYAQVIKRKAAEKKIEDMIQKLKNEIALKSNTMQR